MYRRRKRHLTSSTYGRVAPTTSLSSTAARPIETSVRFADVSDPHGARVIHPERLFEHMAEPVATVANRSASLGQIHRGRATRGVAERRFEERRGAVFAHAIATAAY